MNFGAVAYRPSVDPTNKTPLLFHPYGLWASTPVYIPAGFGLLGPRATSPLLPCHPSPRSVGERAEDAAVPTPEPEIEQKLHTANLQHNSMQHSPMDNNPHLYHPSTARIPEETPAETCKMSDVCSLPLSTPPHAPLASPNMHSASTHAPAFMGMDWMYGAPGYGLPPSEFDPNCDASVGLFDDDLSDSVLHHLLDDDDLDASNIEIKDEVNNEIKQEPAQAAAQPTTASTRQTGRRQQPPRRRTVSESGTAATKTSTKISSSGTAANRRRTTLTAVAAAANSGPKIKLPLPAQSPANRKTSLTTPENVSEQSMRPSGKRERKVSECAADDSDEMSDDTRKVAKLEKNRQSARECRKRKKEYIKDLEGKVESYMAQNDLLRTKLGEVERHNTRLQKQLDELKAQVEMNVGHWDLPDIRSDDEEIGQALF